MNLTEETKKEVRRMLEDGMIQLSKNELLDKLLSLGYTLNVTNCFNYINSANTITHRAKSIDIKLIVGGKSFSHIDADKTFLPQLQEIRLNYFVFENGRIWEL
jgi:hypothetical protein